MDLIYRYMYAMFNFSVILLMVLSIGFIIYHGLNVKSKDSVDSDSPNDYIGDQGPDYDGAGFGVEDRYDDDTFDEDELDN